MSARCVTVPEQIRAKLAHTDDYTPGNILVTCGAGFIASHVATRLIENYPQYMVRCARAEVHHGIFGCPVTAVKYVSLSF